MRMNTVGNFHPQLEIYDDRIFSVEEAYSLPAVGSNLSQ